VHVGDINQWCRCGHYIHNHFQVAFNFYAVHTRISQFPFKSSATRGSIGLMSWAFVLFMMGLALPMGSQILLSWAALMPPATKFPAVMLKSWRFVVSVSILCGTFGTVSAVFLLLISLYQIQYSPVASGESTTIEFTTAPRDAFWLAIACVSIGCLHLIKVHLLFIRDNTWENLGAIYLVSRRRAEHSTGVELCGCFSLINNLSSVFADILLNGEIEHGNRL
jgi:hypothetical protein